MVRGGFLEEEVNSRWKKGAGMFFYALLTGGTGGTNKTVWGIPKATS